MIDFDTVELIALVNATSHYRKFSKRTVDQDRALDQCAWRMKVEIEREKYKGIRTETASCVTSTFRKTQLTTWQDLPACATEDSFPKEVTG